MAALTATVVVLLVLLYLGACALLVLALAAVVALLRWSFARYGRLIGLGRW